MNARTQEVILRGEPLPAGAGASFSFEQMQRMAVSVAKSKLFGVQDADQALALMMIAQAEGKHPALIARDYDIIQGRPAKKSEAIQRDFQASGGKIEWHELTDLKADATFSHPLSPKPLRIVWDMERAKIAGLAGKDMYKKFPRQMLRARCVSEGCRTAAPNSTSGFYTPEEVAEIETTPEAQSVNKAVAGAVSALPEEEIQKHLTLMGAATVLPALETAFGHAWLAANDTPVRDRFKAAYDGYKAQIVEALRKEMDRETLP